MNIDFGVQINAHRSELSLLKPVIIGWGKAINDYCTRFEGDDAPYHHNERANISLLAAGAWNSGNVALEEYPTKKKLKLVKSRSAGAAGRCDLLVLIGKECDFQIEAKRVWMRAGLSDRTIRNRIKSGFDGAFADANRDTETSARIGCVFFPISFRTTSFPRYKDDSEGYIRDELVRYVAQDADLWAWCFPEPARTLKETEAVGDSRYWPGVIMGMKVGKHFRL